MKGGGAKTFHKKIRSDTEIFPALHLDTIMFVMLYNFIT